MSLRLLYLQRPCLRFNILIIKIPIETTSHKAVGAPGYFESRNRALMSPTSPVCLTRSSARIQSSDDQTTLPEVPLHSGNPVTPYPDELMRAAAGVVMNGGQPRGGGRGGRRGGGRPLVGRLGAVGRSLATVQFPRSRSGGAATAAPRSIYIRRSRHPAQTEALWHHPSSGTAACPFSQPPPAARLLEPALPY